MKRLAAAVVVAMALHGWIAPPAAAQIDSAKLHRDIDFLAGKIRVAGTPAQVESADYVLRELASYGFDTMRVEYRVYLPYPDSMYVDRIRPQFGRLPLRLLLNEIPVKGDSLKNVDLWRAMAAYSGGGDVSGPLVFAHLGRAEDYRTLDSLGIDVRGKIVIARLGTDSRTEKVRAAEARGALALVLYSDPADDGFVHGDPFPLGPMRSPDGAERLSVAYATGDPSTPGWASIAGARRLPIDSMRVPHIPVVPIGYRNVMHLLPALGGPGVPQGWQGGLPMRYHVGGDTSAAMRVAIWPETGERAYKTIVNTIATLRGSKLPKEIVLAGAHRDAWGRGGADNASGVAAMLAAARAIGADARAGRPPRRSVVFATWDAGEWGNVGATEYVEQLDKNQREQIVAYVNHDVVVNGHTFSATADPILKEHLLAVAGVVSAPQTTRSILDTWPLDRGAKSVSSPALSHYCGDCEAFRRLGGVSAIEFGFRDPSGVIHSAYDGLPYLALIDPALQVHLTAARFSAALVSRLANTTKALR